MNFTTKMNSMQENVMNTTEHNIFSSETSHSPGKQVHN